MRLLSLCCILCPLLDAPAASAQSPSPVSVTINTQSLGYQIPDDFTGVSIFTETQKLGHRGSHGNLFSAANVQLVTLFKNSGIHHLRLGATGSACSDAPNLDDADIDSLFAFAKATDIKVIYSLHALNGPATAKYVWDHYRPWLDCFAFDNEPDNRALGGGSGAEAGNFEGYMSEWTSFARSVISAAPGAMFTGPDAAGRVLSPRFATAERNAGTLAFITQHTYIGGNPRKHNVDRQRAIDSMLSKDWDSNNYPALDHQVVLPVMKDGFSVRLTESDDYTHGVSGASDAFASALWALDYMHWWAAHNARGVNFQNTEWLATDTFHPDASGNYQINPKAYGIKAFDLGGHGCVEPVIIGNPDGVNLTAYAVGTATNLFVTIINKEHGPGARTASVTMTAGGFSLGDVTEMFLEAPHNEVGATSGITLGGAPIVNNGPWRGQWTVLDPPPNAPCIVTVPATSAVVMKISQR
ncbi:MAG TPA: glycosyl hydrolase family 79 C-terminal domain-containing protein [Verrucomicrobiae bacterium]|nr:glycosyl hydrolase family 79 C-terminal domain-containing protein [Verrucomicrobiae bacterium]